MTSPLARLAADIRSNDAVQKLAGPGLISLAVKVASAGLSYIMLVAFARMLSPEAYGHFGLMMNAGIVLATVMAVGFPVAVMRFWPAHVEAGSPALARGFVAAAQMTLFTVFAMITLIALALSFGAVDLSAFGGRWSVLLMVMLGGLLAISEFYSGLLRSLGRTAWALVPRDVVWRAIAPAAALVFVWQFSSLDGATAIAVCVAVLASLTVIQAIVGTRAVRLAVGTSQPAADWPTWKSPLMFMAASSILFAMVQQLDVIVVGYLVGAAEAGAYFAAQKSASLLGLVMIAGGMVAAPLMSSAFQAGDRAGLQKLCTLLSIAISATTLIGFLALMMFGEQLLSLFDPAYANAYSILVVLALGFAFDALAGPTAYLMQMTKLERHYLKLMAISYAVVLALQLILVPMYGPIAAAAATTIGYLVWNGTAIYLLRKHIGVDSSILSTFLAPKQPSS